MGPDKGWVRGIEELDRALAELERGLERMFIRRFVVAWWIAVALVTGWLAYEAQHLFR